MAGFLVENVIEETVPGSGTVRFGINFGAVQEVVSGDLVASCAVAIAAIGTAPNTLTTTGSVSVQSGFLASCLFTGGGEGQYTVTWTPTLVSGQTLPPRVCLLKLKL